MAYLRLADAGADVRSLPVVIQGLGYHPSNYNQILIICTDGQRKYVYSGGGGGSAGYYTTPAQFTGLRPDTSYGFRVEAIYLSGGRVVPIPDSGWTYFRTKPDNTPVRPGTPSISVWSVDGLNITWRITASSNTTRINIDRDWISGYPDDYTGVYAGQTFYYTKPVSSYSSRFGVDVQGYNDSYGGGSWSGFAFATSGVAPIVVGSVYGLFSTSVTKDGFRLNWSYADNATRYQIRVRIRGSSSWIKDENTPSTYISFGGLTPNTYYEMQVRGYQGSTYGSWSSVFTVRTEDNKPTPLAWQTFYSGNSFNLTAKQWNELNSKINAWRSFKGYGNVTLASAYVGNQLTAAMFNTIVDQLNLLSPPTVAPIKASAGDIVTAAKINRIGNSIDSL